MRRILLEAKHNVLARKKEFFALHGVRIVLSDCAIDAIVTLAMQNPTGARSLRLIIDKLFQPMEHHLPDLAMQRVTSLTYYRETVIGNAQPIKNTGSGLSPLKDLMRIRLKAGSYAHSKGPAHDPDEFGMF